MITDPTPLHNARRPSVEDIRVKAFPIPVYTAAGEVANTCIRVCANILNESAFSKMQYSHFDTVHREHDCMFCDSCLDRSLASERAVNSVPPPVS